MPLEARWVYSHITRIRVIDGDSMEIDLDLGFNMVLHGLRVRIRGYNAPELRSHAGHVATKDEIDKGRLAKAYAETLLANPEGCSLETYKDGAQQTFGRWLATIKLANGEDFAAAMVNAGLGSYSPEW